MNLAVSLDWYIEGPNSEFDWCLTDQDYWMTEFTETVDTMFMWKKSYELFSEDMNKFFPNIKQTVFSTTLQDENINIISNDLFNIVTNLKKQAWKNIWLFGGAKLIQSMLDLKLIDEINILIHPILLWSWTPLFIHSDDRIALKLISSKSFSSWWIQTKYEIEY